MAKSIVYDELKKVDGESTPSEGSALRSPTNIGTEDSPYEDAISKAAKEGNWQSYYNGLIQNANAQRRARNLLHNSLQAQGISTQGAGSTAGTALSNASINANNVLYSQLAAANNQADQQALARQREDQQIQQQRQWAVEDREANAALTREGWKNTAEENQKSRDWQALQSELQRDWQSKEHAASDKRSFENSARLAELQDQINAGAQQRTWDHEADVSAKENAASEELESAQSLLTAMSNDYKRLQDGEITEAQYYANLNAYLEKTGMGSIDATTGKFTPNEGEGGSWSDLTENQQAAIDMYLIGYAPGTANSGAGETTGGYTIDGLAATPMGDNKGSKTYGEYYKDEFEALNNMVARGTIKSGDVVSITNGTDINSTVYFRYNSDGSLSPATQEDFISNGGHWIQGGRVTSYTPEETQKNADWIRKHRK